MAYAINKTKLLSSDKSLRRVSIQEILDCYEEDSQRSSFMLNLVKNGEWECVGACIECGALRQAYLSVINLVHMHAVKQGDINRIITTEEEISGSGHYPIKSLSHAMDSENLDLATVLIEKGVIPDAQHVCHLCNNYSHSPNPFLKAVIKKLFRAGEYDTEVLFGLPYPVTASDLSKRIHSSDNKGLLLYASVFMNNEEKISLIKSVEGKCLLNRIRENMELPRGWQAHVNEDLRESLLRNELGI